MALLMTNAIITITQSTVLTEKGVFDLIVCIKHLHQVINKSKLTALDLAGA